MRSIPIRESTARAWARRRVGWSGLSGVTSASTRPSVSRWIKGIFTSWSQRIASRLMVPAWPMIAIRFTCRSIRLSRWVRRRSAIPSSMTRWLRSTARRRPYPLTTRTPSFADFDRPADKVRIGVLLKSQG